MAVMITVLLGLTLMLDGALSQTRPVIPNTFSYTVSVHAYSWCDITNNNDNRLLLKKNLELVINEQ